MRRLGGKGFFVFVFLLVFSPLVCFGPAHAKEPLRLAVHPYMPAAELLQKLLPLTEHLSRELGVPVKVEITKSYQALIDRVGKNEVAMAYMGPAMYVKMVGTYGKKELLARLEVNGSPAYEGLIFVRADSPIQRLEELAGKRFAFGDSLSTMSYLVPRYMLLKAGVGIKRLGGYAFISNHHNVALGVLMGDYDAGAAMPEIYYKYEKRGLRAIATTPPVSEHLFVATGRLSPEMTAKARAAMLALKDAPGGKEILEAIKPFTTGLVPAKDSDYDSMREILRALEKTGSKP